MTGNARVLVKVLLALSLVVLTAVPLLRLGAQGATVVDRAGGGRDLVAVVLTAGAAPAVGQTTELVLEATPFADAPDLVVWWQVPEGAVLLGEAEEHFGPVSAGQMVTSRRQVRFEREGVFKVVGAASLDYGPDAQFGASGVVFYTIGGAFAGVSDRDPDARSPMGTIMQGEVVQEAPQNQPQSATADPCFTVQGTITRWELTPKPGGFTTSVGVPVRGAYVEVREDDTLFDDDYGDLTTDENGFFETSFCDDDGFGGGDALELYVVLHAEIYENGHKVAEIEDSSWIDEIYEYESKVVSSEGGTLTFDFELDMDQSAVFNIGDAILDAYRMWSDSGGEEGGDSLFDGEGEVHWEPGYGDDGSYYNPFWNEITIADDPSDPDPWDDSVIIHEWGHMADDYYSCDDNPGGDHYIGALAASTDLAWGEGYPDYWQSAVRAAAGRPDAQRYLDINGSGTGGINVNLEATQSAALVSVKYEMAIAGALWDLFDAAVDDQDTIALGQTAIQSVYTGDDFEDAASGFWDDTCNFDTFAKGWVASGQRTDGPTAAVFMQNTGYTLPPASLGLDAVTAVPNGTPQGPTYGAWWNQVTYVVDNSKSMAGTKFAAVKTVLGEAIADLGAEPEGTEFTLVSFDNTSFEQTARFAGQFFPQRLAPAVAGMTTSNAADNSCLTLSLFQLDQALRDQQGGQAWLFTDANTIPYPSTEAMKKSLNEKAIRASVALIGGCTNLASSSGAQEDLWQTAVGEAAGQPTLEAAQREMEGALGQALGLAADEVPEGIVPYLLTALNSGGSFLFVSPEQTAAAADILRAQLTHSAGAGTWSDYVSDAPTYRWDRLASWEYSWIDASVGGTDYGTPPAGGHADVDLPGGFTFYGQGPFTVARTSEEGYITLGSNPGSQPLNTTLPNAAEPNSALYPYWDDLGRTIVCLQGSQAAECVVPPGGIYAKQQGDWFAIEHKNYAATGSTGFNVTFETQLNMQTGEIRFLYQSVGGVGATSATIGLENGSGTNAAQVSYNDVNGASDGMGYKFIPVPPQPSKTFKTAVDAQMEGIAFLLTGYAGSFEKLVVKYPNGQQVSCADTANVLCLDLGLVQYVQANVNGRVGEWQAIVDAGPSGEGTFSFTSMAASAISAETLTPHSLNTGSNKGLVVNLGAAIDSSKVSARFQRPDGTAFGAAMELFDDGTHEDGRAGDGIFGGAPFSPPGAGTAYLMIEGEHKGTKFVRSDPAPFSFQPLKLESLGDGASYGTSTELTYRLTNLDTVRHDYLLSGTVPLGWGITISNSVGINPGQVVELKASILPGPNVGGMPSGAAGEVVLSATEMEQGIMSAAASATVSRRRTAAEIHIFNANLYIRPGGEKAELEFMVVDAQGVAVVDGTQVFLGASMGTIQPGTAVTKGGYFTAEFTSGNAVGTAVVTAEIGENVTASTEVIKAQTEIEIGEAPANGIVLKVQSAVLAPGGTAKVTAVVTNRYGEAVAGQAVRIGVSGDGQMGTVGSGQEVVSGTSNAAGEFSVTFTAGGSSGKATVRAELLVPEGAGQRVVHEDRAVIAVSGGVLLPVVVAQ